MPPRLVTAVLAPSELSARAPGSPARVTVGGRVVRVTDAGFALADALGVVEVVLSATLNARTVSSVLEPGALVTVSGRWEPPLLAEAVIVEHFAAPAPRGDGEFSRFAGRRVGERLAFRARAVACVRRLFDEAGFLEVETPVVARAPNLDPHLVPVRAARGFLITSPEHHMKRLLTGGLPRIYQLARCSRGEEQGALHEPEFTLLEWYRAFAGLEDVIADTEALVAAVASLAPEGVLRAASGARIAIARPFERATVTDLMREHAGVSDPLGLAETDEARFFELWVAEVEPALAARVEPLVVWKYPASQAALARRDPAEPRVAERFELYAGGVELCNGYGELTDAAEQRARFEAFRAARGPAAARELPLDEPLLDALAEGMPPSGGNALGFDRLLALALGATRLDQVIAFPSTWK